MSVSHKPVKTLGSILKQNKDKSSKDLSPELFTKSNVNIAKKCTLDKPYNVCVL